MNNERIYYPGKENVYLDCYILNSGLKLGQEMTRPAVVICPGGGYVYLSPREAEPVAMAYASKGIHAFVLLKNNTGCYSFLMHYMNLHYKPLNTQKLLKLTHKLKQLC